MVTKLRTIISNLTKEAISLAESNVSEALKFEEISVLIEDNYKSMLDVESKLVGSALHKHENLNLRRTWSFTSGLSNLLKNDKFISYYLFFVGIFYSMTLFTTIGYGTIACGTILGQALSVVYSIIGIPL